jgi:uncharacterized membrane protein
MSTEENMKKIFLLSLISFFLLASSVHSLSFYPIKFNAWTGEVVLSENSAQIPIYIQNLGLLSDSYSIRASIPKEYSDIALIENPLLATSSLKTNDVSNINLSMNISSDYVPVKILVLSNTASILRYLEVDVKPKTNYQIFYLAALALLAIVMLLF